VACKIAWLRGVATRVINLSRWDTTALHPIASHDIARLTSAPVSRCLENCSPIPVSQHPLPPGSSAATTLFHGCLERATASPSVMHLKIFGPASRAMATATVYGYFI
jgi:hypothetical protein